MGSPSFLASLLTASLTTADETVGGEAGSRGRASTNFGPEGWLQPHIRCTCHAPQMFFKRQAPKQS